jgi:hypothetical protein
MVKKGFVAEISNDPNLYFYNGMSAYLKGEGNQLGIFHCLYL